MGKDNFRKKRRGKSVAQAARQRMYVHLITLVLVFTAIAAGAFFLFQGEPAGAQSPAVPVAQGPEATSKAKAGFDRLKCRWQRPDGGYVIDIKEIDGSGKMVAAYFNPRPINVSRAEATPDGTTIKVFMELRDINYPGATYNLTYDAEKDQLQGVYFQPALQQSFDVFFVRMK